MREEQKKAATVSPKMTEVDRSSQKTRRVNGKIERAAAVLLQTGSVGKTAQVVAVTERTLRRWRQQPEFIDLFETAQSEIFAEVAAQVRELGGDAVKALASIVRSDSTPAAAKVRAAIAILHLLTRQHEQQVLETRMNRIEQKLRRRKS